MRAYLIPLVTDISKLFLALFLLSGAAKAQVSEPIRPESFVEKENPESLIAVPHWLRGVQFAAEPSQVRPSLHIVSTTALASIKICAHATTIDGRFLATGQYQMPADISGAMLELGYPTDFRRTWSGSTVTNSGIVLSEGPCDTPVTSGTGSRIVPAVFNGLRDLKRDKSGRLTLIFSIHARNTQELQARLLSEGKALRASCEKIETTDAIQFNFICQLALPIDVAGDAELEVIRLNKGRKAPPLRARVLLPSVQ